MSFTLSCFADEISDSLPVQLEVMGRCGIKFMELRSVDKKNVSNFSASDTAQIKNALESSGTGVSAIGSPIGKISLSDDFTTHYDKFMRIIETALSLGTKYIRIFSFYPSKEEITEETFFEEVCERLNKFIPEAKKAGIILLHENEKDIFGDTAPRCLKLMEGLSCDSFGFTFDPANFVQCGQKVMPAYNALKKYVRYIHIKDALFPDNSDAPTGATSSGVTLGSVTLGSVMPAGAGDGEIEALLRAAKADGFNGFISIEPHLGDFAGFAGLERGKIPEFNTKMNAIERFELAYNALNAILNKI